MKLLTTRIPHRYLVTWLLCLEYIFTMGQQPFVQTYPSDVYKGAIQNWDVVQVPNNGPMYIANTDGILSYDGTRWDALAAMPDKQFIYCMALTPDGKLFVSSLPSHHELGYMYQDTSGKYRYHSLISTLPEQYYNEYIYQIVLLGNKVLFCGYEHIFVYQNECFKILKLKNRGIIKHNERVYAYSKANIYIYSDTSFVVVKEFADEMQGINIERITGYTGNSFLVLDSNKNLWVFDPSMPRGHRRHFLSNKPVTQLNRDEYISGMVYLDNGYIAIMNNNKLIFLNKTGELSYCLTSDMLDLPFNNAIFYQDMQHNLWLTTGSSITQVIISSPISYYNKHNGIKGFVLALGKNGGDYYVGTSKHIFYKENETTFSAIPGTEGITFNIFNLGTKLYVAHETGVLELEGNKVKRLIDHPSPVYALCELKNHPYYLIMGTSYDGIWLLHKKGKIWGKKKVRGFEEPTRFIQEDNEGNIWISHYNKGIWKLRLNESMDSVISNTFYDRHNGLPSNLNNRLYRLKDGNIVATTTDGIYHYNYTKDKFEPVEKYQKALGQGICIYTLAEDPDGNIYFWGALSHGSESAGVLLKQDDGSFKLYITPFNKIAVPTREMRVDIDAPILAASPQEIWVGNSLKLMSYNPEQKTFYNESVHLHIKHIWAKDSLIYTNGQIQSGYKLPFARNNLHFEFTSTFYESPEKVLYQYKLEGFDSGWSRWSHHKDAVYTNLPAGKYTFLAKCKNLYGTTSIPVSFSFRIHPPWYKTWWAYILYTIVFVLFLYLVTTINTIRIKKQKLVLKKRVDEKTSELRAVNDEILAQNEEISAINEEVQEKNSEILKQAKELQEMNATKDKLFSIISHDLRGPLSQVKAILSLIESGMVTTEQFEKLLPKLNENVSNTFSLIDNLLQWAKSQMEGIQVTPTSFDVRDIAEENFQLFTPLADRKGVRLINTINTSFPVYADKDMMRLVLRNLVNNAVKFTSNGDQVIIGAETEDKHVVIYVKDTGMGIPPEDITRIFNKEGFSKYGTSGEKGAGLGLMLCQEFIEKNKGTISVESEPGNGSKFAFKLSQSSL